MGKLEDQSIVQSHVPEPKCFINSSSPQFEKPNLEAMIIELEELIKKFGEEKLQIALKIQELAFDRDEAIQLQYLRRSEKEIISYEMANRRRKLDILKSIQEKLSTKPPTRPCSLTSEHVHKQKLHFRVLHGTSNLAEENKHLRRAIASKSKEELDDPSDWLHLRMRCHRQRPEDRVREIKHYQWQWNRKESVAEAIAQGKIWNSLSSNRRDIRDHIKVLSEEFEDLRKKRVRGGQRIGGVERGIMALDRDICDFTRRLGSINRKKEEAHCCILKLVNAKQLIRLDSDIKPTV